MWGLPGPTPRRLGGYAPPNPAVHYLSFECPAGGDEDRGLRAVRPKVNRKTAKTKVLDSFSQSVSIRLVTSLPLNLVLFLIYSLVVNETSPAGFLKGYIFLLVLVETFFLRRTLRSIHRQTGYWEVLRGNPKGGGRPLLCRCGWGIFKGEGESKHPPP